MELLLYVAAFYLWQCVRFVPAGGAVFVSMFWSRPAALRGPGFRPLSPWPADLGLVLGGLSFELSPTRLYSRAPLVRAGAGAIAERVVAFDDPRGVRVRGPSLRAGGKVILRAASRRHATHLAAVFEELRALEPDDRRRAVDALLKAAFDLSAFRSALASMSRTARPLRWCCGVYLLVLFGVVPWLAWRLDGEVAWRLALPLILACHAASLLALLVAERRSPHRAEGLAERLVTCALFPPSLLRAPAEMVSEEVATFHPAAAAAALLEREAFEEFLRREIAEVEHPPWSRHGGQEVPEASQRLEFLSALRSRLLSLPEQLGGEALPLGEHQRRDPTAESFCPLCLADFRAGLAHCLDCGIDSVPYA